MGNGEDIERATDEEIVNYFTENSVSMYLKEIMSYPVNNAQVNKDLIVKYKNGDIKAREMMIKGNLRLVVNVAYRYRNRITHMNILDIIQEGNIGLIRAIESYDPEISSFSNYAIWWIKQAITRGIDNQEKEIRKPIHFIEKKNKYLKFLSSLEKMGKEIPTDEEICQKLGLTLNDLLTIRKNDSTVTVSINSKVKEDEEAEFGDFIPLSDDSYVDVENRMAEEQLFVVLKDVLSPLEYYVIYYRLLSAEQKSLDELGNKFFVTKERIRQIESRALNKIKPYLEKDSIKFRKRVQQIKVKNGNLYNKLSVKPIEPNGIIKYFYIREYLSKDELDLLYLYTFGKYKFNSSELSEYLGWSLDKFNYVNKTLSLKLRDNFNDIESFQRFKLEVSKKYGTKIFSVYLGDDIPYDYLVLKDKYLSLDFAEIDEKINLYKDSFSEKERLLLRRFFGISKETNCTLEDAFRDLNLTVLGYKKKNTNLNLSKLWKVYLNNREDFTEEQVLFLEYYFFKVRDEKEFKYNGTRKSLYNRYYYLIDRLERLYYNIYRFADGNFTKKEYLIFREKYKDKFNKERLDLLDLYYGINGKKLGIQEIACKYGIDYIKVHDVISRARDAAIMMYRGLNNKLDINKELYIPYVDNKIYEFTPETREVLHLFLIDNWSYEEIAKKMNVTRVRVSNIVTDGIRKIDNYRFGIIKAVKIDIDELNDYFNLYNIEEEERKVIILKIIECLSNEEIAIKVGITKNALNRYVKHFNVMYYNYRIRDITISKEDIEQEVSKHPSESILSEMEKEFLCYYYGIKKLKNADGKEYSSSEICSLMSINKNGFYHLHRECLRKLKGVKCGIDTPDYLYIKRDKLVKLLEDKHLPISSKERDIICYLFELNDFSYKTFDELVNVYQEGKGSLLRRYIRAIVNIFKYQNKEIEGIIDYEDDIEPNLKYFGLNDRKIIEMYYKDKLSVIQIANKYGVSFDRMALIVVNIKIYLLDLLNNPQTKKFDFDYYMKVKNNKDLPFYGDISKAIAIFDLYHGMGEELNLTIPEIIKRLNLEFNSSVVNKTANMLMLAVCKYKDGIRKENSFSFEEIQEYFEKHCSEMNSLYRLYYIRYLNREKNNKSLGGSSSRINQNILYDLIRDKRADFITPNRLDRFKVIKLLTKYYTELNKETRIWFMREYDIKEREFMNGKDINHVYRILGKLYKLEYEMDGKKLLLKKD